MTIKQTWLNFSQTNCYNNQKIFLQDQGGGFPGDVDSKSSTFDATNLCVNYEEADTRMILHSRDAIDRGYKRLEVYCRDTGVLLLFIYHIGADAEVYILSGTDKQRKCYPVHTLFLKLGDNVIKNMLRVSRIDRKRHHVCSKWNK
ncbi:hypothetical protein DPMN_118762 [Dreissena polymorpha]|uniref:Uncharacterized protein n=1 Tax=Dreissena polymorpha TaxID=45954 RepID=A0A9D4GLB4_DREPO|nr:hypothetical protein DPMN_118762 [Dreissena polymorpha]